MTIMTTTSKAPNEAAPAEQRVALIGFGEVGSIFAHDLQARGFSLSAWDVVFPVAKPLMHEVRFADSAEEAVAGAAVVICAVTAAQTLAAAQSVCAGLARDSWFVDLNSASPALKRAAASAIELAGGRYVEAAVMSPVPPKRLATPMLLGGAHAGAFLGVAAELGLSGAKFYAAELGRASAAKMCRSVMVKGIEALLIESLLSARHYRVDADVVASLSDLFPGPDWTSLAHYMISRSLEHGQRRAEEMREVAATVRDAGLSPLMSSACAERQQLAPAFASALQHADLASMLDAILARLSEERHL